MNQHLPHVCTWAAWLRQVPGSPSGMAPHSFLLQTCAHRYEARQRVDQILETRDVIGRCFVLSQDLAIHDDLDGGEWKFCEGRPQGHEQFGFCQQGAAAAFSPDSHYLLFGAPGTYNWKGESLLWEGRRAPNHPLTSEGSTWPSMPTRSLPCSPGALPCLPPPSCQHTHEWRYLLSCAWPSVPQHAGMRPTRTAGPPYQHPSHTSSLPLPCPHAAAG